MLKGLIFFTFTFQCILTNAAELQPKMYHQYLQNRWSVEEGLLQVVAASIAQDSQGYIWIGSQIGLSRFDGVKFDQFANADTPQLNGMIKKIYADSQERLWIATNKGLLVRIGDQFIPITKSIHLGNIEAENLDINNIVELDNHQIIVSSTHGLFRVNQIDFQIEAIPLASDSDPVNGIQKSEVSFGLLAEKNSFWVGGLGKVSVYRENSIKKYPLEADSQSIRVEHLVYYNHTIYAGTTHGLYHLVNNKFVIHSETNLANIPIESMLVDSHNNLWVGSNLGLFHLRDDRVVEYIENDNPNALKVITAMYEDRENNLWFGSYMNGIARLRYGSTNNYGVESGLSDSLVWSIAVADEKSLWIGTNSGLERFENGRFYSVVSADELPHPVVYTMLELPEKLILGTRAGIAFYQNGDISVPPQFKPMMHSQVRAIIETDKNNYYFGTSNGLFHYQNQQLFHYEESTDHQKIAIRYIKKTHNNRLLLGCEDGIYELRDQKIIKLSPRFEQKELDVTFIYEYPDSTLIFGTSTNGLIVLKNKQWYQFTQQNGGVPTPAGFYINMDSTNQLWISSFDGLYRLPYASIQLFIEGKIDSLGIHYVLSDTGKIFGTEKSNCCTGAGTAKGLLINDELTLPTSNGITRINTQHLVENQVPPISAIERIKFNDQWFNLKYKSNSSSLQSLNLPNKARDIVVEFTALSLQSPKNIQIKYQLKGYDEDWKTLEDVMKRQASYTNLPAGKYQFLVKSANNFDIWQSQPIELDLYIAPFFYETWWFYSILIGLTLLTIFLWYKWRVNLLENQKKELEVEVEKRTLELSAANLKLTNMSYTDPLTGLKNRRYLHEQINKDIAYFNRIISASSSANSTIALMMVDIDHFKQINDNYGHAAGDVVITELSEILLSQLREDDYIVRWGGEEFLIVSRSVERLKATKIAHRLCAKIRSSEIGESVKLTEPVTCSIGFALMPFFKDSSHVDLSWEEVVEIADKALYKVKQNGRDGWATYQTTQPALTMLKQTESFEEFETINQLKLIASWLNNAD